MLSYAYRELTLNETHDGPCNPPKDTPAAAGKPTPARVVESPLLDLGAQRGDLLVTQVELLLRHLEVRHHLLPHLALLLHLRVERGLIHLATSVSRRHAVTV